MAAIVAALLFHCPECLSAPAEPCYDYNSETKIHTERTRKAARLMRDRRQAGADLFTPEPERDWNKDWAENDADTAYERHLETDDQYRWEDEQDRLRAAAFGI